MRRLTISLICVLVLSTTDTEAISNKLEGTPDSTLTKSITSQNLDAPAYKLYSTENMWTFIKLNTRNGQMWQVQFDVEGDNRFEIYLNFVPLVPVEKQVNGRFTLYSTQNIYTFILLDQLDGNVWQVQWSIEAENRIIVPIK